MTLELQTWVNVAAYFGGGLAMGLGAIGAAIGEGFTASQANVAISRCPERSGEILRSMLVGQAIAESASIFALVVAMILLFSDFVAVSYVTVMAVLGAGLSMGLGAIGCGVGSGFPAGAACIGLERQPSMSGRITTNMLIGSAVCQTPAIFALVTAFVLIYTDFSAKPINPAWAAVLGAGFASGFSAIGSGIGGGVAAQNSVEGVARQPFFVRQVTTVMLLGQAITQTPAILGLLVAFLLLFMEFPAADEIAPAMALLGAGLCMGLGAIGTGIGGGIASGGGVKWVARNESQTGTITRVMLVGMAVSQSTAIYAMVVALVLIFVV